MWKVIQRASYFKKTLEWSVAMSFWNILLESSCVGGIICIYIVYSLQRYLFDISNSTCDSAFVHYKSWYQLIFFSIVPLMNATWNLMSYLREVPLNHRLSVIRISGLWQPKSVNKTLGLKGYDVPPNLFPTQDEPALGSVSLRIRTRIF